MTELPGAVVITGASGGIGIRIVEHFLSHGMTRLICQYRSHGDRLASLIQSNGLDPQRICVEADLTCEDEVKRLAMRAQDTYGQIWGLVNLVGASSNGLSWKLSLTDFRAIIDNNLTATFLTCREFIPMMRTAGAGRIINTSSIVGHTGVAGASHYCAAKAGILGFTKAIALELASKTVTANVLSLGYFDFGMIEQVPPDIRETIRQKIPLQRFGHANEVGSTIRFLLSEDASYISGQAIHINGGQY